MDFTNVYHKFLRLDKWVSEKISLYERKLIHCYRVRFLYAGKLGIQFTYRLFRWEFQVLSAVIAVDHYRIIYLFWVMLD